MCFVQIFRFTKYPGKESKEVTFDNWWVGYSGTFFEEQDDVNCRKDLEDILSNNINSVVYL